MTTVTVKRSEAGIDGISVTGHSGYGTAGGDIVCAAASVLIFTCANALQSVAHIQPDIVQDERGTKISVSLPEGLAPEKSRDAQVIMETILQGYSDVAQEYPKFLKINDGRKSSC